MTVSCFYCMVLGAEVLTYGWIFLTPLLLSLKRRLNVLLHTLKVEERKAFESGILEDSIRLEAKDEVYS